MSPDLDAMASHIPIALRDVRERIARYQDPDQVEIVWVTKTFPPEVVTLCHSFGARAFGENYSNELVEKSKSLSATTLDIRWHFIGGIQSRKLPAIAQVSSVIQSVSRPKELEMLASLEFGGEVLLQVRSDEQVQRNGCDPAAVGDLVAAGRGLGLRINGLMGVASLSGHHDPSDFFRLLRELVDTHELQKCSMGMSGDFELAVACGANVVRLGQILLGARPSSSRTIEE